MEVVRDYSSLVEIGQNLIEPPCFGEDWDLGGLGPFLCQWTCQPVIAASVDVADAEKLAVGEVECYFVDSSP